jgi:SNF2 family DNA or RNA helicase
MDFKPRDYQKYAIDFIIDNPASALFLDMGLGKTVITLTAIDCLMYDMFEVSKVLVIAPLRVAAHTWPSEIAKWPHLKNLRASKVLGSEKERKEALRESADIYIINRENVPWLVKYLGNVFDFDMVVVDELSSFKSNKSQRFKHLRIVRPKVKRIVGLTGTPAPNGLIDLWSQIYLLDRGERLGRSITAYRSKYFTPDKTNGHIVYSYKPRSGAPEAIYKSLQDVCMSMTSKDYIDIPDALFNPVLVKMEAYLKNEYETFEREQVLAIKDGEITAANAAALCGKLLQFANGAVYDEFKGYEEIHDLKIDALDEILDTSNGQPVLVFYSFKSDCERIFKKLKKYNPRKLETVEDIEDWNAGRIELLLAHPASCGHGLNLQSGGNIIVWFGLTWSLELYQQANARLHRQGQQKTVVINHIIAEGTVDEDVLKALQSKKSGQDALLGAVKAHIEKHKLARAI